MTVSKKSKVTLPFTECGFIKGLLIAIASLFWFVGFVLPIVFIINGQYYGALLFSVGTLAYMLTILVYDKFNKPFPISNPFKLKDGGSC